MSGLWWVAFILNSYHPPLPHTLHNFILIHSLQRNINHKYLSTLICMAWSDKLHGSWDMATTYQQTGTLNTNSSPGRFAEVVVLLLYISPEVVPPLPVLPGRVPSPPSPAQARLAAVGGVRKSTRSSRLVSPTSTSSAPPHLVSRSVFYGPTKYEVQISILLLYPAL